MNIAILGAILSAVGFGTANVVIKKALGNISIPQTLTFSFIFGAIFLGLLTLISGGRIELTTELLVTIGLLGVIEVLLYLTLYKAFAVANVTVATSLLSSYPVLATLITVVFLSQSIVPLKFGAILIIVLGAILVGVDVRSMFNGKLGKYEVVKGLPWVFVCLILHAIYFPALGGFTATGAWEVKLLGIKLTAAVLTLVIFVIFRKARFDLSSRAIKYTALLGLLEVIGWIGVSWASSNSTGLLAVIIAIGSSSTIVTAILARVWLKEKLQFMQYFGILLIVIAITLLALS